ncbi:hypothetical protein QUB56_35370 [Microcoleus sp. AR_TQ3_B6]|uniref:hypothetical protein n=1 Tax=Microcoleus sp. AR_TQ3_B6 TaxID=3055284 RepID=UPI002FCF6A45
MTRRFSRLKFAVKMLQGTTPPAGSALANFLLYQAGNPQHIPKPGAGALEPRGGSIVRGVSPFGKPIGTAQANSEKVTITGRAFNQATAVGLDASGTTGANNLNLLETFNNSGGFEAAKIIVFVGASGSGDPTISTITKLSYKKRVGNSYTYPFGATGTAPNDHEQTKATALASAIAAKDAGDAANSYSCTFKPERFKRR